jgi:hypothetical protein
MAIYRGQYTDEVGRAVEGAEVYVYSPNGFLADITTELGLPIAQPILTGADGRYAYQTLIDDGHASLWYAGQHESIEYGANSGRATRSEAASTAGARQVGDTFDVTHFGAVGDGISDDTLAIGRAGAALRAAGGGRLLFPKGTYLIFGRGRSHGGNVLLFEKLSGVTVDASDAHIKVDPAKNWSGSNASFVKFVDCRDCVVIARKVTSPVVPIDGRFQGMEFVSVRGDCVGVEIPQVQAINLLAVLAISDPATRAGSRDIRVGTLAATNCVYAVNCANSGSNITVDNLITDGCGRSFFIYGISHAKARVRSRNFKYAADVVIAAINKGFNYVTDVEIDYTNIDSNATNGGVAVDVGHSFGDGVAGTISNVRIRLNVTLSGGMGSALEYSKVDATGNPDIVDRGHVLRGLQVTGIVRGTSQSGAPIQLGRFGSKFGAGDTISDIRLNGLEFVGTKGRAIHAVRVMPALKGAFYLQDIRAASDIDLWGGASVAEYAPVSEDAKVVVSGVTSTNLDRYNRTTGVHGLRRPALSTSPVTVRRSYRGLSISNFGAGATVVYDLPVAKMDLEYEFAQEAGGYLMRIKPRRSDVFRGQRAGTYLQIDQGDGDSAVAIRCASPGIWDVISSRGATRFES